MINNKKNRGFARATAEGFTQSLEGGIASQTQPKAAKPPLSAGFTLVETLIAVLLLASAIAGPLTIASRSLIAAGAAKDQVTAYYLAQDAIEYIRFARDTNRLRGGDWLTGSGASPSGISLAPCTAATGCYVDSTSNDPATPTACQSGGCIQTTFSSSRFLCYQASTNRYKYLSAANCSGETGTVRSQFARHIAITTPSGSSGDEQTITVTVRWTGAGNQARTVVVEENIYDWQ